MSNFIVPNANFGSDGQNKNQAVLPSDILICGACNFHCSGIKEFACHKEICQKEEKSLAEKLALTTNTSPIVFSTPATTITTFPVQNPHTFTSVADSVDSSCKIVSDNCTRPLAGAKPTESKILYESFIDVSGNHYLIENHSFIYMLDKNSQNKEDIVISAENEEPSILMLSEEPNWENELVQAKKITLAERTEVDDVTNFLNSQVFSQKDNKLSGDTINVDRMSPTDCCEVELQSCLELPYSVKMKALTTNKTIEEITEKPTDPTLEVNSSAVKKSKLNTNKSLHDVVDGGFKCSYDGCEYVTKTEKNISRHYSIHTGMKRFSCIYCDAKFSRQDKQVMHQKIHVNRKDHVCTEPGCTYRSVGGTGLSKHRRTHTNERPFPCQLCSYRAKDSSQLAVHLRFHTGDTPFHCQIEGCASAFMTSSDLKRHQIIHSGLKPFKCSYCSYAGNLKYNLKVHMKLLHNDGEKYVCFTCELKCSTAKHLREHRKIHNVNRKGTKRMKQESLCNYVCEECNSAFVRNDSYMSHMRQHQQSKCPSNKMESRLVRKLIIPESNFVFSNQVNVHHNSEEIPNEMVTSKSDEILVSCGIDDVARVIHATSVNLEPKSPLVTDYSF